jgi:hypothetical protein
MAGIEKNKIISLEQEEGVTEGEENLKSFLTNYYKNLFGRPGDSNIRLHVKNAKNINAEEAVFLKKPFSMDFFYKKVVFEMEHNKASGPDGFTAEFYQHFWELIKWDLKAMLDDFHKGHLNIARLNYGIITLVPKSKEAKHIQKFRPFEY